jgi:adenosine deaminase CECR1
MMPRPCHTRLLSIILATGACTHTPGSLAADKSKGEEQFQAAKSDRKTLHDFLTKLPKGGVLHAHLSGEVDARAEIEQAKKRGFYVRTNQATVGKFPVIAGDVPWKLIAPATFAKLSGDQQSDFQRVDDWLGPSDDRLRKLRELCTMQDFESLNEFFDYIFTRKSEVDDDPDSLDEMFRALLSKRAAEGVGYLELRVNPISRPAMVQRLSKVCDQFNAGKGDEAVETRYVVGIRRGQSATAENLEKAFALAASDDAERDLIVGVDLVGREEAKGAPTDYVKVLTKMRRQYPQVPITLHAGESNDRTSHVRDSVLLGARRIGHGLNLFSDPFGTMELVRENDVLIEVSLLSNHVLYKTPFEDHPFGTYLRCGLAVSLNTDDAGILETTLTDEFTQAVLTFDLSWYQVKTLCENSLEYSFARRDDRHKIVQAWRRRWDAFEQNPPVTTP